MDFNLSAFQTLCARDNFDPTNHQLSHNLPIYATSTFVYDNVDSAMDFFAGQSDKHQHIYSRWFNPTVLALEEKAAAMEVFELDKTAKAICFSSGMAAISAAILSSCRAGDTVLSQDNLYGTTTELLVSVLSELGINHLFVDMNNSEAVAKLLEEDSTITAAYLEAPNNPTMQCFNVGEITSLCRQANVKTIFDNTFNTPMVFQPFQHNVDVVVYSTTKFYNGHGSALGGIVISADTDYIDGKVWKIRKTMGATMSPFDAFLTYNGLKTLPLRMVKHIENAEAVAHMLQNHEKVSVVNYVGLPSHPNHHIAKRQMHNFGSMLSFELKDGLEAGKRLLRAVSGMTLTASLGSTDTLIAHPASMTHVNVAKAQREQASITDGLIRISIGLEGSKDLIAELQSALDKV